MEEAWWSAETSSCSWEQPPELAMLLCTRRNLPKKSKRSPGPTPWFNRWLALLNCELQRSLHDSALAMWGTVGSMRAGLPEEAPLVCAALPFAGLAL